MSKPPAQVTAAEISRIAGVTRATVSNWRRRHADFPAPVGGTEASPLYDLDAVRAWLKARGHASAASPIEELRTTLRAHGGDTARLLPLVLAAARLADGDLTELGGLPDADMASQVTDAVHRLAGALPGAEEVGYRTEEADVLRALLQCVRDEGAQTALDVLAERELEDSTSGGTYGTPPKLADLMARLLKPSGGPYPARVLDPACGGGTLLAAAARHGATFLAGQDSLPVQARRSTVRLLLAAPEAEVTVREGDSLRADAFSGVTVDGVLCNPPYGDRDWGHDELAYDPRWAYGLPARAESELAWVQHALAHLEPGGLAVMLLPPAVAARSSGRRVRGALLRGGAVRAVIALPPGAAVPLHIGLHVWVLQRPDPKAGPPEAVLFVDTAAVPESGRERRGPIDWEALSTAVLSAWRAFCENPAGFPAEPGRARAVAAIELLDEFVDLTPARHVRTAPQADPAATARRAARAVERLATATGALAEAGAPGQWPAAGEQARTWRTATVADLRRGGALTLHRTVHTSPDARVPAEHAGRAVLTGADLIAGRRAGGDPAELHSSDPVVIEVGDVLLPGVLGSGRPVARVADEKDAGCLLGLHVRLLRPDPARLDPWFLAGFLTAPGNIGRVAPGSSSLQLDARRLRVPLLPLEEQRRYGRAFRRLHELRSAARQAGEAAEEAAELLAEGLTSGALLPPGDDPA